MSLIRSCAQRGAEKQSHHRWCLLICPDGTLLELCDSDCLLEHRKAYEREFLARLREEIG